MTTPEALRDRTLAAIQRQIHAIAPGATSEREPAGLTPEDSHRLSQALKDEQTFHEHTEHGGRPCPNLLALAQKYDTLN